MKVIKSTLVALVESRVSAWTVRAMRNSAFLIFAVACVVALPSILSAEPGTCTATYAGCGTSANCPDCTALCTAQCEGHHWNGLPQFCYDGLPGACNPMCAFGEKCWQRTCTCIENEPE